MNEKKVKMTARYF